MPEALRDDALVVRFGLLRPSDVDASLRRCLAIRGYYGLSFFGDNGLALEDVAAKAGLPHRWLFASTNGILRSSGFALRRQGERNHLVLRFDRCPSARRLHALLRLFDGPIANPHPSGGRERRW